MGADPFRTGDATCKCCNGRGVQMNKKTGLMQHCPCCCGSGRVAREKYLKIQCNND